MDTLAVPHSLGFADFLAAGPIASVITGTVASSIAWLGLHVAAAVNLRNKRIDVVISCNQRYDSINRDKTEILKTIIDLDGGNKCVSKDVLQQEIDLYHKRYWGFKSDQLDYWLAGYIDPETLISWFMSTIDALHRPSEIWRDYSDDRGWELVKSFHEVTNFRLYQLIESIRAPEVRDMSRDEQYSYLFFLFQRIEFDDEGLIKFLKRNSFFRRSMGRFKACLHPDVANVFAPDIFRKIRSEALERARRKDVE